MVGKKGPFGGFYNYGIFGIWGKDPGTGKKKYKKVDAISDAAAVELSLIHICRCSFRTSDKKMEPENGSVHLY